MTTRISRRFDTFRHVPLVDVDTTAPRAVLAERLRVKTARRSALERGHEAACQFAAARGRSAPPPSVELLALRLECEVIARALAGEAVL
jgi:hypothetical protein